MRTFASWVACASLALCSGASKAAEKSQPSTDATPPQATVALTKLVQQLPAGQVWASSCGGDRLAASDGEVKPLELAGFLPTFLRELRAAGLTGASPGRANLFDAATSPASSADYEIGGLVHRMYVQVCKLGVGFSSPFGPQGTSSTANLEVEWQVFARSTKQVVATFQTKGSGSAYSREVDPTTQSIENAFGRNARQLAGLSEFRALLQRRPEGGNSASISNHGRIALVLARADPRALAEANGAVVLVSTTEGFGSGVLVSGDGYILTNAHVVKASTRVAIRWSDGIEATGDVIRTHAARDVALIKTNARGRDPLPLRDAPAQVGEPVFAIGSPLDKSLQGTVTRGVVSAKRIVDGFSFIQSDVAVTHGNSGGPLVDERGFVIGLTDLGITPNDVPLGLNLFIPVKDALDFLELDGSVPQVSGAAGIGR